MGGLERMFIGCMGGLAAVCVKFLGQDYFYVVQNCTNLTAEQVRAYAIGYIILTPILIFLGGLLSWASDDETKRLKLLAIAISAPALITTWAGATKPPTKPEKLPSISEKLPVMQEKLPSTSWQISISEKAYAAEQGNPESKDQSTLNSVVEGIGIFFGYGREIKKFWVVAGSHRDYEQARAQRISINNEDPSMDAFVGPPNSNGYYAVVLGQALPLEEAKDRKQKASKLKSVKDVFLSDY